MDVKEDGKIPLFGGKIVVKATRVSWERNTWFYFSVKLSKARGDRPRAPVPERPREEARSTSQASNAHTAHAKQQAPTAQQNQGTSFGFEVKE